MLFSLTFSVGDGWDGQGLRSLGLCVQQERGNQQCSPADRLPVTVRVMQLDVSMVPWNAAAHLCERCSFRKRLRVSKNDTFWLPRHKGTIVSITELVSSPQVVLAPRSCCLETVQPGCEDGHALYGRLPKLLLGTKTLPDFSATEVNLRQKTQRELLAHITQPSNRNPALRSASSLAGRSLETIQHMKAGKYVYKYVYMYMRHLCIRKLGQAYHFPKLKMCQSAIIAKLRVIKVIALKIVMESSMTALRGAYSHSCGFDGVVLARG